MAIVFEQNPDGTFDLKVDGRIREYDVEQPDLHGALRRARIQPTEEVFIEDTSGYRERLPRR